MANEPVFPHITGSQNVVSAKGMMLRDYFAAKALQAMIASPRIDGYDWEYAKWAYEYADCMLEAREA